MTPAVDLPTVVDAAPVPTPAATITRERYERLRAPKMTVSM